MSNVSVVHNTSGALTSKILENDHIDHTSNTLYNTIHSNMDEPINNDDGNNSGARQSTEPYNTQVDTKIFHKKSNRVKQPSRMDIDISNSDIIQSLEKHNQPIVKSYKKYTEAKIGNYVYFSPPIGKG